MSTTGDRPHGLSIPEFEGMLRQAVDQRSRAYSFVSSLSLCWENDQTNAKEDCEKFRDIVHLFGFPTPEQYVISIQDRTPGWTLHSKVSTMIQQGLDAPGRALLLLHYAGHGVERDGKLFFTSENGRSFSVMFLLALADGDCDLLSPDSEIDIVFIFDSCFSHVATRNMVNAERIVEVLAATSPNSPLANAAQGRASFTGKLRNEILYRKGQGHKSVELAEIMDTLITKSPQVIPSYKLLVGVHSLRLELPGGSVSTVVPPSVVEPQYFAVFSVYVAQSLSASGLATLVEWIHSLPRNVGLELDNAYETSSMLFIFRASRYIFLKLNGVNNVTLLGYSWVPNLVSQIPRIEAPDAASKQKENLPPLLLGAARKRHRTDF
ncbi:hypothetical protein BDV34DRAFT_197232 [Aspergillus parasiticus]|uniref:Peptidase C14 caspase domain-containing protein n=1 Tax=Aspergillus parasiticus TaxID=5067 RepID=A0A5N6DK28_ASPPA|nr:hypothetical protein BDV34DRAFT_197232 [Aspergillus parasiticus]